MTRPIWFLILLFVAADLHAQQESSTDWQELRRQQIWDAGGEAFELSEVPEQWLEESVVVLADLYRYNYVVPKVGEVYSEELIRRRVKLLDKAAVEAYSELHFSEETLVGVRVEKAAGEVIYIDPKSAIEYSEELVLEDSGKQLELGYHKYAVSNLEEGDILDFFYQEKLEYDNGYFQISEPVTQVLASDVPIVKQILRFELPEQTSLNFGSYNGASKIYELEDCALHRCFEHVDTMRAAFEEDIWDYVYRSEPMVKFQLFRHSSDLAMVLSYLFVDPDTLPKSSVKKDEIQRYFEELMSPDYNAKLMAKDIASYVEREHPDLRSAEEKATKAYYYFRHKLLFDEEAFGEELTEEGISDVYFSTVMKLTLERLQVPHEYVIAIPSATGNFEELLLHQELIYLIELAGDGEVKYLFNFDPYTNAGDIYHTMEGGEAYRVFGGELHPMTLPVSTAEDNVSKEYKLMQLDEDMQRVKVMRRTEHSGHNRENDISVVLYAEDFHKEFDVSSKRKGKRMSRKKRKRQAAYEAMLREQAEAMGKDRDTYMQDEVAAEMRSGIEDFSLTKVISDGRYHDSPTLSYVTEFDLTDYVQKAGNNYLVDIGRAIGGQVEILESGKERKKDVRMPYARSFENEVKFQIPKGYRVEGVEALNVAVKNETGGFSATAVEEEDFLIVRTRKHYDKAFVEKEKWPLILDFLEAAYDFSQQKVVLKPLDN